MILIQNLRYSYKSDYTNGTQIENTKYSYPIKIAIYKYKSYFLFPIFLIFIGLLIIITKFNPRGYFIFNNFRLFTILGILLIIGGILGLIELSYFFIGAGCWLDEKGIHLNRMGRVWVKFFIPYENIKYTEISYEDFGFPTNFHHIRITSRISMHKIRKVVKLRLKNFQKFPWVIGEKNEVWIEIPQPEYLLRVINHNLKPFY